MKRSTILSFVLLLAILVCFFSSAVLAGDPRANDPIGIDPWDDMDGSGDDSTSVIAQYSSHFDDSDRYGYSLNLSVFSVSSRLVVWYFSEELVIQQTKQVEKVNKADIIFRGKNRSDKFLR